MSRTELPLEPPPSPFSTGLAAALLRLRAASAAGEDPGEVAGSGGDLEPGTLLAAYRLGLFPMGLGGRGEPPLGWWSPDPRGVLPLDGLRVSRSLRRSVRRLRTTVDTAFDAVVAGCADPSRSGRWITDDVARAYSRLHRAGWAHSVEVWEDPPPPAAPSAGSSAAAPETPGAPGGGARPVGGLYGIGVGGLFAGESMFSVRTDASKVALVHLVEVLGADRDARRLLDVQWRTDHLASLGVVEVDREEYLRRLAVALQAPPPRW